MELDYSVEKPRITKLSGPNYRSWCAQVQRLLQGQELWDIVSRGAQGAQEGAQATPTGSAKPETPVFTGKEAVLDAKASTVIMGLCMPTVLQHILLLGTAKEQWNTLKSIYAPLGLQQLSAKIQAFTAYTAPGNSTISEVATQLTTLQYEIATIEPKEKPSDTLKIAIFLQAIQSLDERYKPLILQLEISDTAKDYSAIVERLSEFERRMEPRKTLKETAFRASFQKGKPGKPKFQGRCFNCNQFGHRKSDCKVRLTGSAGSPSTGPLVTPGGGRGLSPPLRKPELQAQSAIAQRGRAQRVTEVAWEAIVTRNPGITVDYSEEYTGESLTWVVDSGCSIHMTYSREAFHDYRALDEPIEVNTASGTVIQAVGQGSVTLKVAVNGTIRTVLLSEVYHVPRLAGSLISVLQLQNRGITIRTTPGPTGVLHLELQGTVIGSAKRIGKAYVLESTLQNQDTALQAIDTGIIVEESTNQELGSLELQKESTIQEATSLKSDQESRIWHRRFGHLSTQSLQRVHTVTTGLKGAIKELQEPCEHCILTKTVRVINRISPEHAIEPLQRIHTDFWGPYSTPTLNGATYILTFTCDYTRKSWVYLCNKRSLLHTLFLQYKATVELESGYKIKLIRCDNAPEYRALGDYLQKDYGIQFEYTTPYTPEQNGVAERLNRSLITVARAMLLDASLPIRFWGDAVITASYLRNRTPIGPGGITPEEAYSGKVPYIGHLRAYGCLVYAYIPSENREKLEPTARRCILIGYMPTSRQYKLFSPELNRIIVATAPKIIEEKRLQWDWKEELPGVNITPYNPMEPDEVPVNIGTQSTENEAQSPENETQEPGTTENQGTEGTENQATQPPIITEDIEPENQESGDESTIVVDIPEPTVRRRHRAYQAIEIIPIPQSYTEAINDSVYGAYWKDAIQVELTKLQSLNTWTYSTLPPGKKAIGCKWVFTIKYTPTGLVDRYKARLVAQGYSQVPGDDFLETFSPTIRLESLRLLLAIGAYENLEIRQIDVVNAYPRSKLHTTVYVKPPQALNCPEGTVLEVNRALYGLKQSGREWYIEVSTKLRELGFEPCYSEPSVFINLNTGIIIGVYVDDMILLGPELQYIEAVIKQISGFWEIKNLGDIGTILGIRVRRNRQERSLKIDQSSYIQELLERYKLGDAKPIKLPISDRNALIPGIENEIQADQAEYQSAIGSLIWIAKGTRFDIAYVVSQLSQYCNNPTIKHWNAIQRVLRYLGGTTNYSIEYIDRGPNGAKLQGYSDADYAGDLVDRRSVTGHIFLLNSGAITWNSTKQRSISTSTTESEYIALSEASKQAQWLRALLRELQRTQYLSKSLSVPIYSDNQACITLSKDPISHKRTKHIDIRYHYIRELVTYGKVTVDYLPTEEMVADILTKPLPFSAFQRCLQGILSL